MYTAFADATHIIPCRTEMPALKDDLGGPMGFRRKWPRALRSFDLDIPDAPDRLDPLLGLLEFAQGDTRIWFDGAGHGEIFEPILIGVGDGTTKDFPLPHLHVFVSSAVIYHNGGVFSAWTPLGGDGITMSAIRFTAAPALNVQVAAKYRRKFKCVVNTEQQIDHDSQFVDPDDPGKSFYHLRYTLQEVSD